LVRYATIGVVVTAVYNGSVLALTGPGDVYPLFASAIAFFVSLPISYTGHRMHTFASHDEVRSESRRFLMWAPVSFTIAILSMLVLTTVVGLPPIVGAFVATVVVPAFNFVLLSVKVFTRRA